MKKIKIIVAALFVSSSINAQITLENTYTVGVGVTNLTVSGYKYYKVDVTNNQIIIYNLNHSVWKTINVNVPAGYTTFSIINPKNISEELFNSNSNLELFVSFQNYSTSLFLSRIIDENGSTIMDFPNCQSNFIFDSNTDGWKLTAYNNASGVTSTSVYGLPGFGSNLGINNPNQLEVLPYSYPNPTSEHITLPYNINETNSTAVMNIYNVNGQIIESFNIDNTFNSILLDLSNYASGLYRYNITVNGVESSSNTFIKQ